MRKTNLLKFLADVNIEKPIVDAIKQLGFDVKEVFEVDLSMDDSEILKLANEEGRVVITNDKDFGELVFRKKMISSGVILLRSKGQNVRDKVIWVTQLLKRYPKNIFKHFVVVSEKKIRFLPMEA